MERIPSSSSPISLKLQNDILRDGEGKKPEWVLRMEENLVSLHSSRVGCRSNENEDPLAKMLCCWSQLCSCLCTPWLKMLCCVPPRFCQIEWLRGLWASDKHLFYWTGEELLPGVTLLSMVKKENFLVPYSTHDA